MIRNSLVIRIGMCLAAAAAMSVLKTAPAAAGRFFFSTGTPDGKIATLSRQASPGLLETETADDFILNTATSLTNAHFTGLLPSGSSQSDVSNVEIEFYHVFPKDSADPPSGNVPTRVNSPADVEIASATRDGAAGTLTFSASILNSTFTAANSVVNGINKIP